MVKGEFAQYAVNHHVDFADLDPCHAKMLSVHIVVPLNAIVSCGCISQIRQIFSTVKKRGFFTLRQSPA